jgi:hypothetical protein
LFAEAALAEVTPEEAAKLGGSELTPLGAERAGNPGLGIPAWTGGLTEPPQGYERGERHRDPYPDDQPLFAITAANVHEHAAYLSDGQVALLRAYPKTWRLNVYPTRRSASYPEWVYEAVKANASAAGVVLEGKGGVKNATVSSPFPIPKSGVEVIWNHNLRWRGIRIRRANGVAAVTRNGRYRVLLSLQDIGVPYGSPRATAFKKKRPNLLFALMTKTIQPTLLAGDGALFLDPIDATRDPRKIWVYSRSLRRVFRAPFEGYGDPAPLSDGLRTIDEFGLFNGPPDRFEWKLLGKRELYVPYNAYRLHGSNVAAGEILQKGHINPELGRYERHRVWVVQGTLKAGEKHVYSRRVFYLDEDSWQIAVADSYDADGRLWRVAEAHALNYYEVPVLWSTLEVFHDLEANRYLVSGLDNSRGPYEFSEKGDPREFSPNALAYFVR